MKLRSIVLSTYGHPNELAVPFSFETRSLCNYVQKHARALEIETEGFNQLVVGDDPTCPERDSPCLIPEKALWIPFTFDVSRYQKGTRDEKQHYFVEILTAGLRQANGFCSLPLSDLLHRVEEFKANGFNNRWIHQTKTIRSHGLVAELHCELTMEDFRLTLRVRHKDRPPVCLDLLSTKPDEICFHHQFKDIVVRGDHLVVTTRLHTADELVRYPLSRFTALSV